MINNIYFGIYIYNFRKLKSKKIILHELKLKATHIRIKKVISNFIEMDKNGISTKIEII